MSALAVLNHTLLGAIAMGLFVSGLFFLRFFRRTHDPFFLLFALSFLVEGANRAALGFSEKPHEGNPIIYSVRLVAYALILVAVLQKNGLFRGQR